MASRRKGKQQPRRGKVKSDDINVDMSHFFKAVDKNISALNNSKIFAGLMIVILNIASKYVTIEVSDAMECYLKTTFSRQVLLFSIIWFGTRDIYISLCGSVLVIIAIDFIFNEKSKFCCLSKESSPSSLVARASRRVRQEGQEDGGGSSGEGNQ